MIRPVDFVPIGLLLFNDSTPSSVHIAIFQNFKCLKIIAIFVIDMSYGNK